MSRPGRITVPCALLVLAAALPAGALAGEHPPRRGGAGPGEYADDLRVLSPRVREYERDPKNKYSYCLRTVATYECLSYASDGSVRRTRKTAVAHGTAFAYRRAAGETWLLTNEHVASWPAVTDEEHPVEDVPVGCKRVAELIKIVDDEDDGFDGNDIALTPVVADPALDASVLKTRAPLKLMPYKLGRSGALRVGNVVAVHGFPLGAFAATHVGKVVNAYDHDNARDWDHDDFVVDALLSPGNSGSPVLALSQKTGEWELVGMYHAGYVRGSALNVVVGIEQLRELMLELKRPARRESLVDKLGPAERESVRRAAAAPGAMFFPYGPNTAAVHALGDGTLLYEVYPRTFPLHDERLLVVEDRPAAKEDGAAFGEVGRGWLGNRRGLRAVDRAALDVEVQQQLARLVTQLRTAAVTTTRWRSLVASGREEKVRRQLERQRQRTTAAFAETAQLCADLADRFGPRPGDPVARIADLYAPTPPKGSVPVAAAAPRPQ